MNDKISWNCTTLNNEILGGFTDDGSWIDLKNRIKNNNDKIVEINIRNINGGATIDRNADGYFIANKLIAKLGGPTQEYIGLGYWKKHQNVVRIKWYDKTTMSLCFNEVRDLQECSENCLIKNV